MTIAVAGWLLVMTAHVLLSVRWTRASLGPSRSFDELAFVAALLLVGGLSVALHAAVLVTGLGLVSGSAALAAWHAGLWASRRRSVPIGIDAAGMSTTPRRAWADVLALIVLTGIVCSWVDLASRSAAVLGADAAHYHVPAAVNLAQGVSLFDLPATPHLYPLAGSVVAAWFLVPVGDPLIVDLAIVLPFVLLVASINWLFRLATDRSGLAWATWLTVLLFSTPLFRASSLGSADLWFAAGFVSLSVACIAAWARRAWSGLDVALAALALGLLAGSKTTGAPSAALIVGVYGACAIVRRLTGGARWTGTGRLVPALLGAAVLSIAAGGVWLIRNWIDFGSPIAPTGLRLAGVSVFSGQPWEPTSYYSALGDLQRDGYAAGTRLLDFLRQWLTVWFVPALAPIGIFLADLVRVQAAGRADAALRARWLLLAITAVGGGILIWMLIGAPWTSLEWTRGFALRYALPVAVLLPLLALLGLFPMTWRWDDAPLAANGGRALLAAVSLGAFWRAGAMSASSESAVPGISVAGLGLALAATLLVPWLWRRGRWARAVVVAGGLGVLWFGASTIDRRDGIERSRLTAQDLVEEQAYASGVGPASPGREVYLAMRTAERTRSRTCSTRRVFALVRFDEPLALQALPYRDTVFYGGRDVEATRRAGPLGPCDYIITNQAELDTNKGQDLIAALAAGSPAIEIAKTPRFIVIGR